MEIKQIQDKNKWEQFISLYSPQSLFQSWNWGETIENKNENIKNKKLWRIGLYDKNDLVAIAQIEKVTARRGEFFHIRHGPIFKKLDKEQFKFLLNYLRELSSNYKTSFIRISPLIENSNNNKIFFKNFGFKDAPIHRMDGEYCWVLDLEKSENEILAGMRKTSRYLIKTAQKLNVKIESSTDIKDLDSFIKLYKKTAQRQGFVKHKGIMDEFKEFRKDNQIVLYKGFYNKKLLAAALIIFYNHQAIYHHSASIQQKIPVNYLLQWHVINDAKNRGHTVYNFWGIAPDENRNHPWQGLTLFKKGFGGRAVEYLHAMDLPLSYKYCATYIIETFRRIRKNY